jgi:hypothetical protein
VLLSTTFVPYDQAVLIPLILGFLAVARVTQFLVDDRLALGYRQWAIRKSGTEGMLTYLVHCPWCTSIWVSLALMPPILIWPRLWLFVPYAVLAASYFTGRLHEE